MFENCHASPSRFYESTKSLQPLTTCKLDKGVKIVKQYLTQINLLLPREEGL